jgi:N-acetyl-anhydromuramyl-L-alanine amidase AmpD/predicted metal-dependent hydrolase
MQKPNLNKIIADNLDKAKFQTKSSPGLPGKYNNGGTYISDRAQATSFGQYQTGGQKCPKGYINIDGKCIKLDSDEYRDMLDKGQVGTMVDGKFWGNKATMKPIVIYSSKDKDTNNFFKKLSEGDPEVYEALVKLQMRHGNPHVSLKNKPSFFDPRDPDDSEDMRPHYNPDKQRIYLQDTDNAYKLRQHYLAELAHQKQVENKGPLDFNLRILSGLGRTGWNMIKNFESPTNAYKREYDTPGSLEYEAHEEIEPKLQDEYYDIYWDKGKESDYYNYPGTFSDWKPTQTYKKGGGYFPEYHSYAPPRMKEGGGLLSRTVTCSNCGWSWKAVDGGIDPMTCHKCGDMIKMEQGGLTEYGPGGQTTDGCGPGYSKHPLTKKCIPNGWVRIPLGSVTTGPMWQNGKLNVFAGMTPAVGGKPKAKPSTTFDGSKYDNGYATNDSNSNLTRQQEIYANYVADQVNQRDAQIAAYKNGPYANKNLSDNEIVQLMGMNNQSVQNQGTIKAAQPDEGILSRGWNIASNPMTALSYAIKGQDIPNNFQRGEKNILDNAVNIINPATYINSGYNLGKAVLNPWQTTKTLSKGAINLTTNLTGDGNVFNDNSNAKSLELLGDVGNMLMLGETGAFKPLQNVINTSKESGLLSNTWKLNPTAGKIPFLEGKPNWLQGWSKEYSDPTKIDFSSLIEMTKPNALKGTSAGRRLEKINKNWNKKVRNLSEEQRTIEYKKYNDEYNKVMNQGLVDKTGLSKLFDVDNMYRNGVYSDLVVPLKSDPNTILKFGKDPFAGQTEDLVMRTQLSKLTNDPQLGLPFYSQQISNNRNISLMPKVLGEGKPFGIHHKPTFQIPRDAVADMAWKLRKLRTKGIYPEWKGDNFMFDPNTNKLSVFDLNTTPPNTSFGETFATNSNKITENPVTIMKENWMLSNKKVPTSTSSSSEYSKVMDFIKEQKPSWFMKEPPKTKLTDIAAQKEADEFLQNFLKNKDKQSLYTPVDLKIPIYGDNNLGINPHLEGGRQVKLKDEGSGLFQQKADKFEDGYNLYDLLHGTNYHLRKNEYGGDISTENPLVNYYNNLITKYGPGGQATDGCGPGSSYDPVTKKCKPNGWVSNKSKSVKLNPVLKGDNFSILPGSTKKTSTPNSFVMPTAVSDNTSTDLRSRIERDSNVKNTQDAKLNEVATEAKNFMTDYYNSPMFQQLYNSSISGDKKRGIIKEPYHTNLDKITWNHKDIINNDPNFGGQAYRKIITWNPSTNFMSYEPQIEIKNEHLFKEFPETAVHEASHIFDNLGVAIPKTDMDLMNKYYKSNKASGIGAFLIDDDFKNYVAKPTETLARLRTAKYLGKKKKIYDPFKQKVNKEQYKKIKNVMGWDGFNPIDQLELIYSPEQIIDMMNKIAKNDTQNSDVAKYGGSSNKYGPGGSTTDGCPAGYNKHPLTGQCVPNGWVQQKQNGPTVENAAKINKNTTNKCPDGFYKNAEGKCVKGYVPSFTMPKNVASSTAVVRPNVDGALINLKTDPMFQSLTEATNSSDNFLTSWYKGRVNDSRYGKTAQERFDEIPKIKENIASDEILNKLNAQAYYMPFTKDIYINPNDIFSRSAATQVHEKFHELYDQVPQRIQDDIIQSLLIPKKNWVTPRPDLDPEQYGYNYFSNPTEVGARLHVFRRRFGIDPRKKYSASEMQKIINYFNSMQKNPFNWFNNQQSGDSDIQELFNIIGNDPKRLAKMNDEIVMNQSQPQTTAEYGGDISVTDLNNPLFQYYNKLINKYGPGGQTTDGCPANFYKNAEGKCVPYYNPNFTMPSAASDATSRVFFDPVTKKMVSTATTGQTKENIAASTKDMGKGLLAETNAKKARVQERKNAKAFNEGKTKTFTFPTGETKTAEQMSAREQMYVTGKSLEGKGRFNEDDETWYDDFLNPLNWITSAGGALATAPYVAKQSGSNMPYVSAIVNPLIGGRMMGSGSINPLGKNFWTNEVSNSQFLNSMAGGIPGTVKGLTNRINPIGIMRNRLNSRLYNPTTALNVSNNTVTGVKNNLTNSAIEGADLVLGDNNLRKLTTSSNLDINPGGFNAGSNPKSYVWKNAMDEEGNPTRKLLAWNRDKNMSMQDEYIENLKNYYNSPAFKQKMQEFYPDVDVDMYVKKTLQNLEEPMYYSTKPGAINAGGYYRPKNASDAYYIPGYTPTFKQKVANANTKLDWKTMSSSDEAGTSLIQNMNAGPHELRHQTTNGDELLPDWLTKKELQDNIREDLPTSELLKLNEGQYSFNNYHSKPTEFDVRARQLKEDLKNQGIIDYHQSNDFTEDQIRQLQQLETSPQSFKEFNDAHRRWKNGEISSDEYNAAKFKFENTENPTVLSQESKDLFKYWDPKFLAEMLKLLPVAAPAVIGVESLKKKKTGGSVLENYYNSKLYRADDGVEVKDKTPIKPGTLKAVIREMMAAEQAPKEPIVDDQPVVQDEPIGPENQYIGTSIVDYLATKGYSGTKTFRKQLAKQYGVENYDFSESKNIELLNKLRQNDDMLEENESTFTPISVEKMMQMEREASIPKSVSNKTSTPKSLPREKTVNAQDLNARLNLAMMNFRTPPTPKPNISFLRNKMTWRPAPSAPVVEQPVVEQQVAPPAPQGLNPTVLNMMLSTQPSTNQTPFVQIPNNPFGSITGAVRRPPQQTMVTPSVPNVDNGFRAPFQPVDQSFSYPIFNGNQQVASQQAPVVAPVQQPVMGAFVPPSYQMPMNVSESTTPPDIRRQKMLIEAYTNNIPIHKVPSSLISNLLLDGDWSGFKKGTFKQIRPVIELVSPDLAKQGDNYFRRQELKNNDNLQEAKTKLTLPKGDLNEQPAIVTGDTIRLATPGIKDRYIIPSQIDLKQTSWGIRNRGDYTPIETEGGDITLFNDFVRANEYFKSNNVPDNASFVGVDDNGKVVTGTKKDFVNTNIPISRTFSNKIVDFAKDGDGKLKLKASSAKASNKHLSPVTINIDETGKKVEGSINLLIPKKNKATNSFGDITGGRVIFTTPDGKESVFASGSADDIATVFKNLKAKGNYPYLTAFTLDNGTYGPGLRKTNGKITSEDLKEYQGQNTTGSVFLYLKNGNYSRGDSKGAAKLKYKDVSMTTPNIRTEKDESYKKGHPLVNEQSAIVLHHTGYSDTTGTSQGQSKAMKGVIDQFSKPGESSHVVIDFNGTRYNYAKPSQVTFHAGKSMLNGRENVNDFGIGIEFQGDTDNKPLTDAQIESFVEYITPIIKDKKIPLENIITHKQIRSDYMKAHPEDKKALGKPDVNERDYNRIKQALIKKGIYQEEPTKKKKFGGSVTIGDEMDVTEEQLEQLKKQGYKFDII